MLIMFKDACVCVCVHINYFDNNSHIYTGGYFQCGGGQMVKGYAGKYGSYNKFKLLPVSEDEARHAEDLVHISNQVINVQQSYAQVCTHMI